MYCHCHLSFASFFHLIFPCFCVVSTEEDEDRLMQIEREVFGLLTGEQGAADADDDTMCSVLVAVAKTIITSCIGIRGVRPAQPVPAVMSPLPRRLSTQARSVAKPGRGVRGLLVPLPYPSLPPSSKCHHPSSRLQPFSSPRAISLRADCHLCSEKYSPFVSFLDLSSTHLLSSDLQDAAASVLKVFHVRDPQISPY